MSRTARTTRLAALVLAMLSGFLIQAGPASADSYVCGHWVRGAIPEKYNAIGGTASALGCPITEELTTPNGRGKYTHFQGGSIYWTSTTGAHPVWGQIRTKWGALGWETGTLRFPTSDETQDTTEHGVKQTFSRAGTKITWSAGGTDAPCSSECVSIQSSCTEPWVNYVKVYFNQTNQHISVEVTPSSSGFDDADDDTQALWEQVWRCVSYPFSRLTASEGETLYKQLACHAEYSYPKVGGGHLGGETWDLESWRSNPDWDYVLSPTDVWNHECNWA